MLPVVALNEIPGSDKPLKIPTFSPDFEIGEPLRDASSLFSHGDESRGGSGSYVNIDAIFNVLYRLNETMSGQCQWDP